MLIKSSVFKLILGSLFILGLAATGVIYTSYLKPVAPTNLDITFDVGSSLCTPIISFTDSSVNEDEFRLYRRKLGGSTFALIQIFPSSSGIGKKFSYTNYVSPGTYEYRASAYNGFGESYSEIKAIALEIYTPECEDIQTMDPATPMNPIIVSLSIINDCNVRISFRDNSTNEQGFKIVRSTANSGLTIVATLGPHAGIPGTYDDKTKLPPGKYYYFINVYNQKGNLDSNSEAIEVTSVCNPVMQLVPTVNALAFPTAQKLSAESCTWNAVKNAFLRKGPNVGIYDKLLSVEAGQSFPIIGQSEDEQFWAVETGPGAVGYITKSETYSRTDGDCSSMPTLPDPPPPVIQVAPTKKPGGGNNGDSATATACPIGMECP
jgi:hypothetical protein